MKLLRKGIGQKGWARELICTGEGNGAGGCQALLLVEQEDLFQTNSWSMGEENGPFATFKCSECGVLTDTKEYPSYKIRALPSQKHKPTGKAGVL